jgi:hypothetical protein
VQRATGAAVRELQERLLVHAREVHTEGGAHKVQVESWEALGVKKLPAVEAAKRELEAAVRHLGAGAAALPWQQRREP